jgi:hypothetical protein
MTNFLWPVEGIFVRSEFQYAKAVPLWEKGEIKASDCGEAA